MPPVDYAALANQVRQTTPSMPPTTPAVDYAALAKQVREGGTGAEEPQSLLGAGWEGLKQFGRGGLELVGRPLEFAMGTAAGTAQTGSLAQGLKRGTAALLEPELVNSQIQENTSKLLEEQFPEFVKAHPYLATGIGLAGDVTFDPTNLLFGAGFLRRGGMAALKGLGASEELAKTAMLVPVGEAWQKGVQAGFRGATKAAAATPLGDIFPSLKLKTLIAEGRPGFEGYRGLTGEEAIKHIEAQGRGQLAQEKAKIDKIYQGLSNDDLDLLEMAANYPNSPQAAQVAANPKLADALKQRQDYYAAALQTAIDKKILTPTRELGISTDVQQRLAALPQDDRELLQRIIRTSETLPSGQSRLAGLSAEELNKFYSNSELQQLAKELDTKIGRVDEGLGKYFFADPKTLELGPDGMATVAQAVPNYGPIIKPSEDTARFASNRLRFTTKSGEAKNITFQEAVEKHGAITNSKVLMENYARDLQNAIADTDKVRLMAGEFGQATARPGYRQLSAETIKRMPAALADSVKDVHLPTVMADDIDKYMIRMINPNLENGALGVLKRTQRLWKTMATSLGLPAFQANNLLGNDLNMYAAGGMSPLQIFNGQRKSLLAFLSEGKKTTSHFGPVTVGGRTYRTDAELLDLARQNNIIGTAAGFFGAEKASQIPEGIARLMAQERGPLAALNPDWAVYDKLRDLNQTYIEDTSKFALFMHELQQGKSVEQASTTVRRVLFDYEDLSDAEKTIRNYAMPFYTWMRKNVPLQLATMIERPAKIAHQGKLLNAFSDWTRIASGEAPTPTADLPEYLQTGEYVPVPFTGEAGSPATMRVRFPWFDVNAINPENLPQQMAERLTPLVRVPYSLLTERDVVTGQPLGPTDLSRPDFLGRFLPTALGGRETPEGRRQTSWSKQVTSNIPVPFGPILRGLFPMEDQETLGRPTEVALRSFGLTPRVLSPEVLKQAREAQKRQQQAEKRLAEIAAWQGSQ